MKTRVIGSVFALIGVVLFASLSAWQWQRATWKERLLDAHARALAAPPVSWREATAAGTPPVAADLPADTLPAGPSLPLRVRLSGQYVPESDIVLDNQRVDGQVGVMVLSLLAPDDGGPAVYINRGFLPYEGNRRELPALVPVDEAIVLSGLLVAPPAVGVRLGDTSWQPGDTTPQPWIDVEAGAARLGRETVRAVVLLDADAAHGFTRRWQALPNTLPPDQHRGYAFQWLALAIAVAVIYLILTLRRRR
jgi:cytochrome oxidase assembly protein ShyY1